MKRFIVLGALALCLLSGTAAADKARDIASDADSRYHAAHLENHLDTTDVQCVVNNLRVRDQADGQEVLGHLEQADRFRILEIENGWVRIEVEKAASTSPDSWAGLSGWVNADYVDCFCSTSQYNANTADSSDKSDTDVDCQNYDEVIELYARAIKEHWDGEKIAELGFEPTCFVDSLENDGYMLKDLNQDGNDELIILAKGSLTASRFENFEDMVYAVYTLQNNKPVRALESWTRSRNYLCADGGIYNEGSDGALYSTWCIYDIRDGKTVIREGVQTTDKALENGNIKMAYLRMTESHKLYDGEEISEEQADADLERYQNMLLNDDSDFVPFAEYEKKSR